MAEATSATNVRVIKKSIAINAPKERVWEVLFQEQYTRKWFTAFMEGIEFDTDWSLGSKATFTDKDGNGIVGKIVTHKPAEALTLEFTGGMKDGAEDYESEEAKAAMGSQERYRVKEQNGGTLLEIEADMDEKHFEMMSGAWEKALQMVKELAEG